MPPIQSPFTEEHEAFRRSVRAWVEKELAPHALEWDRAGIFPREVFKRAGSSASSARTMTPRGAGLEGTTGSSWHSPRSSPAAGTPG